VALDSGITLLGTSISSIHPSVGRAHFSLVVIVVASSDGCVPPSNAIPDHPSNHHSLTQTNPQLIPQPPIQPTKQLFTHPPTHPLTHPPTQPTHQPKKHKKNKTDLADIYAYNKSAEMVGQAFALQPGLREKFQIVYKVRNLKYIYLFFFLMNYSFSFL
jgi:hypothetical protein